MATQNNVASQVRTGALPEGTRAWNEFAYIAFARIVVRKHSIPVPEFDLSSLTDSELEQRLRLVSELAHLPPA